jgi:hypothetical protein
MACLDADRPTSISRSRASAMILKGSPGGAIEPPRVVFPGVVGALNGFSVLTGRRGRAFLALAPRRRVFLLLSHFGCNGLRGEGCNGLCWGGATRCAGRAAWPPGEDKHAAGCVLGGRFSGDPAGMLQLTQAVLDGPATAAEVGGQAGHGGPADGLAAGITEEYSGQPDGGGREPWVADQVVRQRGERLAMPGLTGRRWVRTKIVPPRPLTLEAERR